LYASSTGSFKPAQLGSYTHKDSEKKGDGDGVSCGAKTASNAENKHKLITNANPGTNNKYN